MAMPTDNGIEHLDDEQRPDRVVLEHDVRCVAEAQAADHHIETGTLMSRYGKASQRDFGQRESARH